MNSRVNFEHVPGILIVLLLIVAGTGLTHAAQSADLETRIVCQMQFEDWRHSYRVWPEEISNRRPTREQVLPDAEIVARVKHSLELEQLLARRYGWVVDQEQIQAELNRVAQSTHMPERLAELFALFDHDPQKIGDCLIRPQLVERHWIRLEEQEWVDLDDLGLAVDPYSQGSLTLPIILESSQAESGNQRQVADFPDWR